jgi:hypothetical protein
MLYDIGHVENYDNDDVESEVLAGMEMQKELLENWADEQGLDYRILESMELAHPVEPSPWSQSADPKNVADKPIS